MAQTIYVNPTTGNDSAAGDQSAPLKTLSKALQQAQADTTIQLAAGTYNGTSGEIFPLQVPSGVKLVGNEGNQGSGILIEGNGEYISPTLAKQNITILLENSTEVRGITITNKATRGTGIWIESTDPMVTNCTFTQCNREGVLATGTAQPNVVNNNFIDNGGNGISFTKNAQGEIKNNTCKGAGYGISIDGNATPRVVENLITENRFGLGVSVDAQPILRDNRIENNEEYGIAVTGNAKPDLGTNKDDPGNNIFRNNGKFAILNSSQNTLVSWGNALTSNQVSGSVQIEDSIVGGDDDDDDDNGEDGGDNGNSSPDSFSDIQNHWAKPFIQGLLDNGLISGFQDGTFKPDQKMTRAEYAALLVKAFNPSAKRDGSNFSDVADDFWATDVIQQAYRGEFLSGFPDNSFKPNDNVQRAQVIVSLVNGLGLSASGGTVLSTYSDRAAIPDYAKDEVSTATKKNIVVSYPDTQQLNPTKDATRAEVAAMVYQTLVDGNQVSAVNSDYIVSASPDEPKTFPDIQNHWAKPFIEGLLDKGLISGFGDGTFKPNDKMTRAQYAALLVKAFDPEPKREAKNFLDVSDKSWAKDVIQQAYRGEFLSGYPGDMFRQGDNVERVQVVVSLVNGLGLSDADTNALGVYEDSNDIPDYAKDEVATATKKQIVVNHPEVKQLNPTKDATRAEVAAMVYQALVDGNKVSAINSDYIVSA